MKKFRGFDSRAIKQFFILNVEKIVFGVSMLLVALFIYGAISQEPYAKTPEQLRTSVKAAKDNMEKIVTIPPKDMPTPPKFVEVASRSREEVPAAPFETKVPWKFDNSQKMGTRRGEPILLAVRELETTAGTGPFALKDLDQTKRFAPVTPQGNLGQPTPGQPAPGQPGRAGPNPAANPAPTKRPTGGGKNRPNSLQNFGEANQAAPAGGEGPMAQGPVGPVGPRGVTAAQDSVVEGVRWICVTGLVPYREQIKKYNDEFGTAQLQDLAKDFPFWAGFLVERAEVTQDDLKDPAKSNWKPLSVKDARHLTTRWSARAGEVVDPAYTDEGITFPLGPLLERNWGKEVAHSKIPVLDITQRGASGGEQTVAPESAALADAARVAEGDEMAALRQRRTTTTRAAGGGEGGPGARTAPQRTLASRSPAGGYGRGGEGGQGGQAYAPRVPAGFEGGEGAGAAAAPPELEFLLFRFFDFTVEEGKRYRYRVQLVLDNPNHGFRPQYLKDAKFSKDDFVTGPLSDPSPVASVTSFNELYVGPVKATEKSVEEPKVQLIAVQLDPKLGTKAVYEMRNAIAARKEKREMLPVPRGQLIQFQAKTDVIHPLTRHVEEKTIDFNANVVVLDIRGGERFSPGDYKDRETMPGEVLFMDANGFLTSRSEATDEQDYLAEAAFLEGLRLAKETNSTLPVGGGLPGGEGGEGAAPIRGRGAGS